MNRNLYNLLQTNSSQNHLYTSTQAMPNILHDMLKSSPPSTSNTNDTNFNSGSFRWRRRWLSSITLENRFVLGIDSAYSSLSKSPSAASQSPSPSHRDYEIDQMISSKLSKKLKTMDRSSPLFRRMVVAIMRHQMNKSKNVDDRRKILSTPPAIPSPSSSSSNNFLFNQIQGSSSMDLELSAPPSAPPPPPPPNPLPTSTFDLDVEAILDFERTTFGDCSFDIHDLPNLWCVISSSSSSSSCEFLFLRSIRWPFHNRHMNILLNSLNTSIIFEQDQAFNLLLLRLLFSSLFLFVITHQTI